MRGMEKKPFISNFILPKLFNFNNSNGVAVTISLLPLQQDYQTVPRTVDFAYLVESLLQLYCYIPTRH